MSENILEKKLSEEPIVLPGSPFWEVFKVFGRDELIALFINTGGTFTMANFVRSPLLISVTGPVVEKFGFFLAYFKEAWEIYSTTPKTQRESIGSYTSIAFKRGFSSFQKDVLVHDPLYTFLLYFGLKAYPQTPAWMLSILSFVTAVGAVATLEVTVNELRFYNQVLKYKRAGFGLESYLESRFFIKDIDPEKILSDFSSEFGLLVKNEMHYHDRYFENNLKTFNCRRPVLRFRQRSREEGGQMQTLQIAYTRASEIARSKPGQFNYYPTLKNKLWIPLSQEMPWKVEDITDSKLRGICKKIVSGEKYHDVFFERSIVRDPKTILISIDRVNPESSAPFTVIEIKSHMDEKSKAMLISAMRYLMLKYEVVQTTHTKSALTSPGFA